MDTALTYSLMILVVFILVFANAFFVVSEFSIVKMRKTKLVELAAGGNKKAAIAVKISEHMDSYLSAIQLGITLASLGLGWIGEPAISRLLEDIFAPYFENNRILLRSLSFGIAFSLITLLHVVVGELIPKSLAIRKTEFFVLWVAYPLYWFNKIFYPFIFIFDKMAAGALRAMGVTPAGEHDLAHSEEEIKLIINASQRGGIIDQTESEIIKNAVDFSDITAHEIMIPRQDIQCLYVDDTYEDIMNLVKNTRHTRYPLCDDERDNIIGMVHIRDILVCVKDKLEKDGLKSIMREIIFVPENISISEVLHRMMRRHIHMAIVVDEYGGTDGLISMEDILEELVGEIMDEHDGDVCEPAIKKVGEGVYEFDGLLLLDNAFKTLEVSLDEEPEEDTIGGYVFGLIARRPKIGDKVADINCDFEVLAVKGMRITRLKAIVKKTSS